MGEIEADECAALLTALASLAKDERLEALELRVTALEAGQAPLFADSLHTKA
jgi:hypothetical protein